MFKKVNIISGHYGCGKTNFSINLALYLSKSNENVTIIDMDIVNPYFRTSDYLEFLNDHNINVVSPVSAGSTLDSPYLPSEIFGALEQKDGYVIIDAGGDDVGATVLGRFSKNIIETNDYEMFYIINKFRKLISTPPEAVDLMREIEYASHLKIDGIINNSHLARLTTANDILSSQEYAKDVCNISSLPLIYTTAPNYLADELKDKIDNLFPVDIIVKLPWA